MRCSEAVLVAEASFQASPPTHPLVDLLRRLGRVVRDVVRPERLVLKLTRTAHPPPSQRPLPVIHSSSFPNDDLLCQRYSSLAQTLLPSLSPICDWLAEDDIQISGARPVSAGGFADIWRGTLDTRPVAIKSYRRYLSFDLSHVFLRFSQEALVCSRLSHRNIVSFIGVYSTTKHPFSLVFDFAGHLDLREYLQTHSTARRLEVLADIARGLNHMHDLDIIHGGLKIENVLVDFDGTARIAGLGSAFILGDPSFRSELGMEGPCRGRAPELVYPEEFGLLYPRDTKASDIYAFGVLAWEVLTGSAAFSDSLDIAAAYRMWKGVRPPRPDHAEVSDRVWEMIERCWDRMPSKRPAVRGVARTLEAECIGSFRGAL